jgi:ribosomal protein S18 acetylase RimI-like enzyme
VIIRGAEPRDQKHWRELFDAYIRFYEREPSEVVTRQTWSRLLDPASSMHAIIAEADDGSVVGIANYVIHDSTSALRPVCYLQDLFVDPRYRGAGVGKQLIDWLVSQMPVRKWSRIYWHTKENNYRARALYDKYSPHSGFVRYVILNPDADC